MDGTLTPNFTKSETTLRCHDTGATLGITIHGFTIAQGPHLKV